MTAPHKIVCICKGIRLGRISDAIASSDTVLEVNQKTGCGSGGCQGSRCSQTIGELLKKKSEENTELKGG